MQKNKIVLDTDIGDDIDDAFALSLLTQTDGAELLAVTTVFKNTLLRARQAKTLLCACGKADVPVFAGESMPVSGEIVRFDKDEGDAVAVAPCQYDESMQSAHIEKESATDAIVRLAKQYSGELILVAIGPLTNIARAIAKEPSIICDIKKIVTMGGWFTNYRPEWNILCDPEAAAIVYSSKIDSYAVGLDVTLKCILDDKLLTDFRNSEKKYNALMTKWIDRWQAFFGFTKSVMHDPLAAASVSQELCRFEKTYVKVTLEGTKKGAIEVSNVPKDGFSPISVAVDVDTAAFYKAVREKLL